VGDLQGRLATAERELEDAVAARMQDASALDEARGKRKMSKVELAEARNEIARLNKQVSDLVGDVEDAHKHIDQLEQELEAVKGVLEFEVHQNDEARFEPAEFRRWQRGAANAAQAAESARLVGKGQRAAGFAAPGSAGGALHLPRHPVGQASSSAFAFAQRTPSRGGGAARAPSSGPPAFR
jgi:chromosome segregation ATPase